MSWRWCCCQKLRSPISACQFWCISLSLSLSLSLSYSIRVTTSLLSLESYLKNHLQMWVMMVKNYRFRCASKLCLFPSFIFFITHVSWHTSFSSFNSKADNTPLCKPSRLFLLTCFEFFLHFEGEIAIVLLLKLQKSAHKI
jgi:hypothetical protein